jgi:Curlin associated repeat
MRIVTGFTIFLTMAATSASGHEVFIAQLTGKASSSEQTAGASSKVALAAAVLASPLQPSSIKPFVQTAPAAASDTSFVAQFGTGNLAAVVQTGAGNFSSIVQHGAGNQATVTQRQGAH